MASLGLLLGTHRHRSAERPLPLLVRYPGARRRHRHRAGRGRAVRARRNPRDAEPSGDRRGDPPEAARAVAEPRGVAPVRRWPIARGTVLGFLIGIIPGSAHIISSFLSYAVEKKISKTPGGIRQGRGRGRRGTGIGEQRGLDRRVRADARARHSDRPGHRGADGRADDPRRAARPEPGERSPAGVLGLRRLDVCRQPDAARAQPAAGRAVRAPAAHSLRVSLSAHHHVLRHRRVRGRATRSSMSGSC